MKKLDFLVGSCCSVFVSEAKTELFRIFIHEKPVLELSHAENWKMNREELTPTHLLKKYFRQKCENFVERGEKYFKNEIPIPPTIISLHEEYSGIEETIQAPTAPMTSISSSKTTSTATFSTITSDPATTTTTTTRSTITTEQHETATTASLSSTPPTEPPTTTTTSSSAFKTMQSVTSSTKQAELGTKSRICVPGLKTSLFANPDEEDLASTFNRYFLKNYHHGQTQITIKLGHLFDQTLTCQWLLFDDEWLKTSATVHIKIKESQITLTVKFSENRACTETHFIENRKVSEEIKVADVRFHSYKTPLSFDFSVSSRLI